MRFRQLHAEFSCFFFHHRISNCFDMNIKIYTKICNIEQIVIYSNGVFLQVKRIFNLVELAIRK